MIACQLAYVCAISKMRLLETMHNFPEDSKQRIYQRHIRRVTVDLFALVHCQDIRQAESPAAKCSWRWGTRARKEEL